MNREIIKVMLRDVVNLKDDRIFDQTINTFMYIDQHCTRSHFLVQNKSLINELLLELWFEQSDCESALIMSLE